MRSGLSAKLCFACRQPELRSDERQAQEEDKLLMAQRKTPHPELGAKRHVEGRNAIDPATADKFTNSDVELPRRALSRHPRVGVIVRPEFSPLCRPFLFDTLDLYRAFAIPDLIAPRLHTPGRNEQRLCLG